MHKFVLQPKEVGKIEIIGDTAQFIGPKTRVLFLVTEKNRGWIEEFRFWITADSEENLEFKRRGK